MIKVDGEHVTVAGNGLTILSELINAISSVYECIKDGTDKSFALRTMALAIYGVIDRKGISATDVLEAIRAFGDKINA